MTDENNEGLEVADVRAIVTEQVKHAYYERKTITEVVGEIVSALQASAMVVPDGWQLVPVEPTAAQCFTAAFNLCNEFGDEFVRDNKQFALSAYRRLVAASPAPGDSK